MSKRIRWQRIAAGDYEAEGGIRMYQIPDCYPPAWNVYQESQDGDIIIVDGAASMRDARAFAEEWAGEQVAS